MGKLNGQIADVTGGNRDIGGVKVSTNPQRTQDKKYVIEQEDKKAAGKQFMQLFRSHLDSAVNEYNAKMGERIMMVAGDGDRVSVTARLTRQESRSVDVEYSEPRSHITISRHDSTVPHVYVFVVLDSSSIEMKVGNMPAVQISAQKLVEIVFGRVLEDAI